MNSQSSSAEAVARSILERFGIILAGFVLVWLAIYIVGGLKASIDPYSNEQHGDYGVYVNAAQHLFAKVPVYWTDNGWKGLYNYHYHPFFALLFIPLASLPFEIGRILWGMGGVAAYLGGLWLWWRIGQVMGLPSAALSLGMVVGCICFGWVQSLWTGNVSLYLFFASGLMAWSLIRGNSALSVVLGLFIALTKPNYLFPLAIPLFTGNWKLTITVLLGIVLSYFAVSVLFAGLVGVPSSLGYLQDYFTFMAGIGKNYPWQGRSAMFYLQNYSIKQSILRYSDFQAWVDPVVAVIQLLSIALYGYLTWLSFRYARGALKFAVLMALLGALEVSFMLPQYDELLIGSVIFGYVMAGGNRFARLSAVPFLLYVFSDWFHYIAIWSDDSRWSLVESTPLILFCAAFLFVGLEGWLRSSFERIRYETPQRGAQEQGTVVPQPSR